MSLIAISSVPIDYTRWMNSNLHFYPLPSNIRFLSHATCHSYYVGSFPKKEPLQGPLSKGAAFFCPKKGPKFRELSMSLLLTVLIAQHRPSHDTTRNTEPQILPTLEPLDL